MKNGVLRFIPLQADLCLNKQKVDIEDFKGWQKCNAPVYGDCLSPLYKKEDDHHDIYIGNDTYDWENGALKKNGVTVWSGGNSHKITKAKINEDYDALSVNSGNYKVWAKITSSNSVTDFCHNVTRTETIPNAVQIVAVKVFEDETNKVYGVVVMYLHSSGKYGYMIRYYHNGTMEKVYGSNGGTTLWDNFDVISPLIQVGVVGVEKFIISFFGSSGANLGATQVKNVYVSGDQVYDNPLFSDASQYTDRYGINKEGTKIEIKAETSSGASFTSVTDAANGNYKYKTGIKQIIEIKMSSHPQPIRLLCWEFGKGIGVYQEFTFPPSAVDQTYKRTIIYYTGVQEGSGGSDKLIPNWTNVNYYYHLETTGISSSAVDRETTGTGRATPFEEDIIDEDFVRILPMYTSKDMFGYYPCEWRINYNRLSNENSVEAPPLYDYPEIAYIEFGDDGFTVNNYCAWTRGDGATAWSSHADFSQWLETNKEDVKYGTSQDVLNPRGFNPFYAGRFQFKWSSSTPIITTVWQNDWNANIFETEHYSSSAENSTKYYFFYPAKEEYTLDNPIKTLYTDQSLKEVDCCMDDGHLYCVGSLTDDTENPLPTKVLSLSGTFSSFDKTTNTINYTSDAVLSIEYDQSEEENVFPKYYVGMSVSIQNYYLRIVYLFKAKKDDTDLINIVVDNLAIAFGETPSHLLGGAQRGTNANLQGGVYNCPATEQNDGWRLLFNNNILSNVGCYEKGEYIGTILADWFSIDGDFCIAFNQTSLYYKDNNGTIWKLELVTEGNEWDYRLVEDRYIVFNTTNYFNCYDTKTGVKRHWASDYNNRMLYGYGFTSYSNNNTYRRILEQTRFNGLIITAQNANYEMTKDMITGLILGAIVYDGCLKDTVSFLSCKMPYGAVESIDLYRGDNDSTSAIYVCSYSNAIKFVNNDLVNPYAVYPISENGDIQFNPNLFTMFIKSYNNKDMVISDGIAYRLVYFNNVVPVMAYYMLDGVEELIGAFVLQTSYYGVSESRLYQMNYSNGVGVEVVADITNMEYLGALPSQALFWSAQNRAIYSFKGNCIMTLMQYANELTGIYGKWYNPATQELFLDTNIGILVFSDLGTYCLEWETETEGASVKDIFFFKDHFIVNLIDDTEYSYFYSYNNKEGYTSNGIFIFTKYYGNGLVPITVNNVYVRLYNQSVADAEGNIIFKGHTITDIGTETDEKTVVIGGEEGEAWDTPTDTMLVKYTPQYNRGLGFALEIKTTFPIIDIKFDYVENGSIESQIAHINI